MEERSEKLPTALCTDSKILCVARLTSPSAEYRFCVRSLLSGWRPTDFRPLELLHYFKHSAKEQSGADSKTSLASHFYSSLVYSPTLVGKSCHDLSAFVLWVFTLRWSSSYFSSSSSTLEPRKARQLKARTLPSVELCGLMRSPRMCTSGTCGHCTDVSLFIWWCLPCVKISCCAAERKDTAKCLLDYLFICLSKQIYICWCRFGFAKHIMTHFVWVLWETLYFSEQDLFFSHVSCYWKWQQRSMAL